MSDFLQCTGPDDADEEAPGILRSIFPAPGSNLLSHDGPATTGRRTPGDDA